MYCLISARSTNAESAVSGAREDHLPMAWAMLDVAMISTFLRCLSLSSWVRRALTTLNASDGSEPAIAPARAAVRLSTSSVVSNVRCGNLPIKTTTNPLSSSTISVTVENSFCTSFPDSENHFENSECELISTILPCV